MLVLSSPSGAGKSSIARELLTRETDLHMSVSATTRPPREGEVDGKDYHFISIDDYKRMEENSEFLESAKVFDNYYATPKEPVMNALKAAKDVLFDIDWQGTQQVSNNALDDLVRVFILPPDVKELERRLRGRAQDPEEVIQRRMSKASAEMSHYPEYDYVVINVDLEEAIQEVQSILKVERMKRTRQVGLPDFVKGLMVEEG
ncbi:MAG: guanylate kinase [Rhodospirillales bacterium]|nr:guanylate kinase [Rhodospirillales bacterium]